MANESIKGMGFHHVALRASNLEKSLAFYKALGMKELVRWGRGSMEIVMLDIGDGSIIELFANRGVDYPAEGRFQHFAFCVDDVEAAYHHALSVGARSHIAPKIAPQPDACPGPLSLQVAFVLGPDDEQLEFFKYAEKPAGL